MRLLNSVCELMRQQYATFRGSWCVGARGKGNLVTNRVGQSIDGLRRLRRLRVRVHAHFAEVVAEAWLENARVAASSGWPGERSTSWIPKESMPRSAFGDVL